MTPSPPCAVCLDLNPFQSRQVARWQARIAKNWKIEQILPFCLRQLKISSQTCAFCSVIKNGIISTYGIAGTNDSTLITHDFDLDQIFVGEGRIIVLDPAGLEVEFFEERDEEEQGEEKGVGRIRRLQFFVRDSDQNHTLSQGQSWGQNDIATSQARKSPTNQIKSGMKKSLGDVFGTSRDVPSTISLKAHIPLIKSWIASCLQNHSSCDILPTTKQLPSRLLDISRSPDIITLLETAKLSTQGDIPPYATLSHCWGSKKFIQTTIFNIESYYVNINWANLPSTYRDAISVVRGLSLNYLWIDSICIIQDSRDDWKRESALMASIYSNSYLNIAATRVSETTQGCLMVRRRDSESIPICLPRFPNDPDPAEQIFVRKSLDSLHGFYTTPIIQRAGNHVWENEILEAPLLQRAWVFQERYLAPRTLHFCAGELVMECRQGMRCECTGLDLIRFNPLRNGGDISYDAWLSVVEEYSRLLLTYESDRLIALMGVAEVFQKRLGCAYLQGIWEGDLVRGLLWSVARYDASSTEDYEISGRKQKTETASTWSWASMILSKKMGINFPAAHDKFFSPNQRFRLLDMSESLGTAEVNISGQTSILSVQGEFLPAIAFLLPNCGQVDELLIVFDFDYDDLVLITSSIVSSDVFCDVHCTDDPWEVSCLILGFTFADDDDTDELDSEFLCTLVLEPSLRHFGTWERIGVLDIRKDSVLSENPMEQDFILV